MPKPILLLPLAAAAIVCTRAGASLQAAAATKTIGSVSAVDVRAKLVATRSGGGAAPTARVSVQADELVAGRWRHVPAHRLAGTYFWNTVTGPAAICHLDLVTAGLGRAKPHLRVQLLVSPSLGCGKEQTVTLGG
ncbi:MAG TPA: hypothetical protein VHC45_06250 [Gaiellaceae bacterium]|jgi:hypothetical protein|nr:hypothetical protein [Gaiellaceae bacterium]